MPGLLADPRFVGGSFMPPPRGTPPCALSPPPLPLRYHAQCKDCPHLLSLSGITPCARTAPPTSPSQVPRPVQGLRPHAPRGLPVGPGSGGAVAPAPPPVLVQTHKLRVAAPGESLPACLPAWVRCAHAWDACMGCMTCMGSSRACGVRRGAWGAISSWCARIPGLQQRLLSRHPKP